MSVIQQTVKLDVPIAEHEQNGRKTDCCFRNGIQKEKWTTENWQQKYSGNFFRDCLHTFGVYEWCSNDNLKYTYEGGFYANVMEGYGLLSYPDGKFYEGLFKNNRRYGPGVATYPDGTQDVGLWDGNTLVRLNQDLQQFSVPLLAETIHGKAFLLNYKTLVSIPRKDKKLNNIFSLNDKFNVKDLYSPFVRNTKSLFFNENSFYDKYFDNNDWVIDFIDSYKADGSPIITKILITNLLAWNNEQLNIDIMLHAFLHRNFEKLMSFDITSVLTGQRNLFRAPGKHEVACLRFLESCCKSNETVVVKHICGDTIYPDISDCLGNNGIFYAAAYDQQKIIKILTNFGANVDHLNDECLTPLIITILRYIALKYNIITWENAFLPQTVRSISAINIQMWRNKDVRRSKKFFLTYHEYFFDLKCVHPSPTLNAIATKVPKPSKSKIKSPKGTKNKTNVINEVVIEVEDPNKNYFEKILNTFIALLNCGANPNYGEVPFPPLICGIFSRCDNFLEYLFQFGANANIRTAENIGSLTPLHIVCSLPPCSELITMAVMLIKNGAEINASANIYHWEEEKEIILAGTETDDVGKTPLQLLCMRYDFKIDVKDHLGNLCNLIINYGANVDQFYLGHTALSLAILRGNVGLMRRLLSTGLVNPNRELGNQMGVPLTVLVLKRYESILPVNVCDKVYACLIEYFANPFNIINEFDLNAIEFCEEENNPPVTGKKKVRMKKSTQQVIKILNKCAETTLLKYIKAKVIKAIYQYKFECSFENPVFDVIVKIIDSVEEASKILQILLVNRIIYAGIAFCDKVLRYVESKVNPMPVKGKKQIAPRTILEILQELRDNVKNAKVDYPTIMPELETDDEKYKVCFECFQKKDKKLILCPNCCLVYFCSLKCNIKNNNKRNSKHPCRNVFYEMQRKGFLTRKNLFVHFEILRNELMAKYDNYDEYLHEKEKLLSFYRRKFRIHSFGRLSKNKSNESNKINKRSSRTSRGSTESGKRRRRSSIKPRKSNDDDNKYTDDIIKRGESLTKSVEVKTTSTISQTKTSRQSLKRYDLNADSTSTINNKRSNKQKLQPYNFNDNDTKERQNDSGIEDRMKRSRQSIQIRESLVEDEKKKTDKMDKTDKTDKTTKDALDDTTTKSKIDKYGADNQDENERKGRKKSDQYKMEKSKEKRDDNAHASINNKSKKKDNNLEDNINNGKEKLKNENLDDDVGKIKKRVSKRKDDNLEEDVKKGTKTKETKRDKIRNTISKEDIKQDKEKNKQIDNEKRTKKDKEIKEDIRQSKRKTNKQIDDEKPMKKDVDRGVKSKISENKKRVSKTDISKTDKSQMVKPNEERINEKTEDRRNQRIDREKFGVTTIQNVDRKEHLPPQNNTEEKTIIQKNYEDMTNEEINITRQDLPTQMPKEATVNLSTSKTKLNIEINATNYEVINIIEPEEIDKASEQEEDKMSQMLVSPQIQDAVSDICEPFDYKFYQMFMPYCVCINGQLFYRFGNIDVFHKLNYSDN